MEDEAMINVNGSPSHPVMEVTPVGSPEDLGFPEAPPAPSAAAVQSSSSSTETIVLTDDLRDKIIRQVEYYFSDENLPTDKYLLKYVKKNKQGFVPIAMIASFKKMKKLVQDSSLVVAALKESSQLILSSDGKKVKRIHPLLATEIKDAKSRTVFVENLPENCSTENLQKIFGEAGKVINICIRDPHAIEDSTKNKTEMVLSGKVHALVEYETVEAADKAVGTLNDEKNWRSGLRVELLQKRMDKYGLPKRGWKGAAPEKNNNTPTSDTKKGDEQNCDSIDHHNDRPDQEDEEHLPNEKTGRSRGRNRGRSKAQKQQNTNGNGNGHNHVHGHGHVQGHGHGHGGHGHGHGHGHGYVSSSGVEVLSKPPPGPKMPDGTKGFTMGRGRPLSSSQN